MSSERAAREHRFSAALERAGSEYCVEVPLRVTRALGGRGRIAVTARTEIGFSFNATLRPRGDRHRLFLNDEARAGKKSGKLTIVLIASSTTRSVATPSDLTLALREADLLDTWSALPPGKREHIIRYVGQAVHERTREKRIAQAVEVTERRREQLLAKRTK